MDNLPSVGLGMVFDDKQQQEGRGEKITPEGLYVRLIFEGSYDAVFNSLSVRRLTILLIIFHGPCML